MSSSEHRIFLDTLADDLARAFAAAAHEKTAEVTLELEPAIRGSVAFVDAVLAAAPLHPGLASLRLSHPGASFGFAASTLSLRMPGVRVQAVRSGSEPPAAESGVQVGMVAVAPTTTREELRRELLRKRGETIAVLFDPDSRPSRAHIEMIGTIARELGELRVLVLIHDSPSIGFIASSLSLQLPRVAVRTERTTPDAEIA